MPFDHERLEVYQVALEFFDLADEVQIKEARGLRRLLLRGFAAARAEFRLVALTHNLLKLFRSGRGPALLTA
ncbi:MAG: hypothetical protein HY744_28190, partial [Deltaproteobacteria bacterium]|nr:hypothetical protein [Deltaproteobacteria bacterium]